MRKTFALITRIRKLFYRSDFEKEVDRWFGDKGDLTLRLNYPNLFPNSIVFDIGGYHGDFAHSIYLKYKCNVFIFEPVMEYYNKITSRFAGNLKIRAYPFALGSKTMKVDIAVSDDGSSIIRNSSTQTTRIDIQDIIDFIKSNNIQQIDLMKINIEGAEYDLLDHLINNYDLKKITNFQVQFHDFLPDAEMRMNKIQLELSKTHELTYQYKFVWENWTLKK